MFKKIKKIVLSAEKKKNDSVSIVCQRSQCRTTHKRKDC